MADAYVPTTEEVRDFCIQWGRVQHPHISDEKTGAAFDRWLAAHDAEVRAIALADTPETVEVVARALAVRYGPWVPNMTADAWRAESVQILAALREHLTPSSPDAEESDQ